MGIQGLLPFVKKAVRQCSLTEFRGQTIAVDASCWIHKGAYGCANQLAVGQQTDAYVQYCIKCVNSLLSHGLKVILVFDGASLPAKKKTNDNRREKRQKAKEDGYRSLSQGDLEAANKSFSQAVDITSEMVGNVIQACNSLGKSDVKCIVSPYESDAQLTYLNLNGYADLVLSEDSDLIVFGCKKILFKCDLYRGDLYELDKLPQVTRLDLVTFRRACILSGCDYTDGLPRYGLVKATQFFQKVISSANRGIIQCLKRLPLVMNDNKTTITARFLDEFVAAENTFLYQLVFDPNRRTLVPLNPYPDNVNAEKMLYAGRLLDDKLASEIASGYLCPHTHRRREGFAVTRLSQRSPMKKRRTPAKSPGKSPASKSPGKSNNFATNGAFQMAHVRNVDRRVSPRKTVSLEQQSYGQSTLSMYAAGADETLTSSRYFSSTTAVSFTSTVNSDVSEIDQSDTSSPVNSTVNGNRRPKKRSVFETLGDEADGDESESGYSSGSLCTSTPKAFPTSSKMGIKKYAFRSSYPETKPSLLENLSGSLSKFRYERTDCKRNE